LTAAIAATLNAVSAKLTTASLQSMDGRVSASTNAGCVPAVASQWLAQVGLAAIQQGQISTSQACQA
jgi:glycine betaine/choline ABC-type transport system substrate-binding protein